MQPQHLKMSSQIDALHGVGQKTLQVFANAGLRTLGDIYGRTCGQPVQLALNNMRAEDEMFRDNDTYWKGLATRVQAVIARVRSDEARPYEPDHFICPITHQLMLDPVLSKYGDTYERDAIERLINERGIDIYRRPLTTAELYQNRSLQQAIEYYREHELRFAFPIKWN
jgi:hypothetical protein